MARMPSPPDADRQSPKPARKRYTPSFLRAWRELTPATQDDLAEAIGVTRIHVSNVERGVRPYTQDLLERAVAYLRTQGLPSLTPADVIGVNPESPDQGDIALWARKLSPPHREAATDMLRGLAQANGQDASHAQPVVSTAPAPKARRRGRSGRRRTS